MFFIKIIYECIIISAYKNILFEDDFLVMLLYAIIIFILFR